MAPLDPGLDIVFAELLDDGVLNPGEELFPSTRRASTASATR